MLPIDQEPLPAVRVHASGTARDLAPCCTGSPGAESIEIEPAAVAMIARVGGGELPRRRLGARPARHRLPGADHGRRGARAAGHDRRRGALRGRSTWSPPATRPAACAWSTSRPTPAPTWAMLPADLLGHLRFLFLHQQLGELPGRRAADRRRARRASPRRPTRVSPAAGPALVDLLRDVLEQMRDGADPRLPLELALVRVCRPATDLSIESIGQRLTRARGPPRRPLRRPRPRAGSAAGRSGRRRPPRPRAPAASPPAEEAPPPPPLPPPGPMASAPDLEQLAANWTDAIVPEIGRRSVPLQSLMQHASPRSLERRRGGAGLPPVAPVRARDRRRAAEPRGARVGARPGGRTPVRVRPGSPPRDAEPAPPAPDQPSPSRSTSTTSCAS